MPMANEPALRSAAKGDVCGLVCGRWPVERRRVRRESQGSQEIDDDDLAFLERLLPPSLGIAPSTLGGLGLHARRAFAPGTEIAQENAFVWLGPGSTKPVKAAHLHMAWLMCLSNSFTCYICGDPYSLLYLA